MTISVEGLNLIKKYEGLRLKAYQDSVGVWTIGYGHTRGVKPGMTITTTIAEELLREDIAPEEKFLNGLGINFRQGQFDALMSFLHNFGDAKFNGSTLKKKILAGAPDSEICAEFKKWNKAGGKVLAGLVKRREDEAKTWVL